MIKFVIILLISYSTLITCNKIMSQQVEVEMAMMATPPPAASGSPFSNECYDPVVSGFSLRAKCFNDEGNQRNASVSFTHCIRNYDGNLSGFNGSFDELYAKNCYTDGISLICDCQQPTGAWASCSADLDDYFFSNNGILSC